MLPLLLAQNEHRGKEIDSEEARERQEVEPEISVKPSAFVKAPTLIGWYQADGKPKPSNRPPPEREDTGTSRPEKFTAGIIAMTMVANTAETCVRVKVETSCPKPVDAPT